jgi:hypothetical protein
VFDRVGKAKVYGGFVCAAIRDPRSTEAIDGRVLEKRAAAPGRSWRCWWLGGRRLLFAFTPLLGNGQQQRSNSLVQLGQGVAVAGLIGGMRGRRHQAPCRSSAAKAASVGLTGSR